jgi:hypothetical protein
MSHFPWRETVQPSPAIRVLARPPRSPRLSRRGDVTDGDPDDWQWLRSDCHSSRRRDLHTPSDETLTPKTSAPPPTGCSTNQGRHGARRGGEVLLLRMTVVPGRYGWISMSEDSRRDHDTDGSSEE